MNPLITIFRRDINRIPRSLKPGIIMLLFFAFSLYFVQDGSDRYENTLENLKNFSRIEREKVEKYEYYTQYAGYGFGVEFLPSPLGIFFYNSGIFPDLTAHVNAGEKSNLYNNLKGRDVFINRPGNFNDFAGSMIFLGSLMTMFYLFASLQEKEDLRFQAGVLGRKRLFWSMVSGKFLVLALFFSWVTACGVFLALLNGIIFTLRDYLLLAFSLGVFLAVILVFVFIGIAAGSLRSKASGIILIILLWIGFFYLYPTIVRKIVEKKSQSIPGHYDIEKDMMEILTKFEKKFKEILGKNALDKKVTPENTALTKDFLDNEFKKLLDIDAAADKKVEENAKLGRILSILTPTGLYSSISGELSSKGYDELLLFSRYNRDLKSDFGKFYFKMKFILKKDKVESFIKNRENIYYGKSRVSGLYWLGLLFLGFNLAGFSILAYNRFGNGLYHIPGRDLEECKLKQFSAAFRQGECRVWVSLLDTFRDMAVTLFSGQGYRLVKEGFTGNVVWNDRDLVKSPYFQPFLYICKPESLPGDMRVKEWVWYAAGLMEVPGPVIKKLLENIFFKSVSEKKFKDLSQGEKIEVLLLIPGLRQYPLYLFNDTVFMQPLDTLTRFVELMEKLKDGGATVIYVTSSDSLHKEEIGKEKHVMESEYWTGSILVRTGKIKGLIEPEPVNMGKDLKRKIKTGNNRYKKNGG